VKFSGRKTIKRPSEKKKLPPKSQKNEGRGFDTKKKKKKQKEFMRKKKKETKNGSGVGKKGLKRGPCRGPTTPNN